ncbi:MAG: hypothetical protein HGB11_09055 [Chlorobiales bacterium]|nr:hypothetical protein [Chlorobiales bacterium]
MSNKLNWVFNRLSVLLLALIVFFTIGCDNDDNPSSTDQDHFEAEGIYISNSGVKVIDYYGPDLPSGTSELGPVNINVGDNGHWDMQFYNSSKQLIGGPDEADHYLAVEIQDVSKAKVNDAHLEVTKTSVTNDGWTQYLFKQGVFGFHIQGVQANSETKIRFKIIHVDHADFITLPIKLNVSSDVSTYALKLYDPTNLTTPIASAYMNDYSGSSTGLALQNAVQKELVVKMFAVVISGGSETSSTEKYPATNNSLSLQVTPGNAGLITVGAVTTIDHPTATGQKLWKFPVTGTGNSDITLKFLSGGAVTREFNPIPVTVN